MRNALLVLLALLVALPACSSRPKATEEDRLYYYHGGDTVRRKRTEHRTYSEQVWNHQTQAWEYETRSGVVTVLEIEDGSTIVDYPVSTSLGNKLREGQPLPALSKADAAAAGLVGDCVRVLRVVEGGNADAAGVQADDLILRYAGQPAHGRKRLNELTDQVSASETTTIEIERDGKILQLTVNGAALGVEVRDEWR